MSASDSEAALVIKEPINLVDSSSESEGDIIEGTNHLRRSKKEVGNSSGSGLGGGFLLVESQLPGEANDDQGFLPPMLPPGPSKDLGGAPSGTTADRGGGRPHPEALDPAARVEARERRRRAAAAQAPLMTVDAGEDASDLVASRGQKEQQGSRTGGGGRSGRGGRGRGRGPGGGNGGKGKSRSARQESSQRASTESGVSSTTEAGTLGTSAAAAPMNADDAEPGSVFAALFFGDWE